LYKIRSKSHKAIFIPTFRRILGTFKGKTILDVGCGNGGLTAEIAKQGARIVGVDKSKLMLEEAARNYGKQRGASFVFGDATKLSSFRSGTFDSVIINMVLINIETKRGILRALAEASRVLKDSGTLIFSDLNPLCIESGRIKNRKVVFGKSYSYFKDGSQFKAYIRLGKGKSISFVNRHWRLETYLDLIKECGLYLDKIIEPGCPAKDYKIPEFIVFSCKKR
jgi:ubiquinone/menaquinone biosynthesis C-methylase UbiE